jgi:hypothetical protein
LRRLNFCPALLFIFDLIHWRSNRKRSRRGFSYR